MPVVSLVVATLGAAADLPRLFDSLDAQSFRDFDVTVVDQNAGDHVTAMLAGSRSFPVRRLHTPTERGVSRGRNAGWRATTGEVLIFPDDNCWYPPDFIATALTVLADRGADIVTGRVTDTDGKAILAASDNVASRITPASVWTAGIEWMTIVRRAVLAATGGFDADIGVGAATPWQAAELQDLLLRAIRAGFVAWYDPAVVGYDVTWEERTEPAAMRRKARSYGRGMGYVLALHRFGRREQAKWLVRSAGGLAVNAARRDGEKVAYYWQTLLGRFEGMRGRLL